MASFTSVLLFIQACLLQTAFSQCGCGYLSGLPAVSYGSSSGFGYGSSSRNQGIANSGIVGCGGANLGIVDLGSIQSSATYGTGASAYNQVNAGLNSVSFGSNAGYGAVGTGLVGAAGDIGIGCGQNVNLGNIGAISQVGAGLGFGLGGVTSNQGSQVINSVSAGAYQAYGGVGTGEVGVAGDIGANGNTIVVGSVPVLGAVEFSGFVPVSGSVSVSGQCGYGCI